METVNETQSSTTPKLLLIGAALVILAVVLCGIVFLGAIFLFSIGADRDIVEGSVGAIAATIA